jgi:peptide-methionine (R)-S-oxide reductase
MRIKIKKSEEEWKKILTPGKYRVLRQRGTELPFTGKYTFNKKTGTYLCAACGNKLFKSETKFESGTGWPSFWAPYSKDSIKLKKRKGPFGEKEVEVVCAKCGSHLGHLFHDAPQTPTGNRFCMNSIAFNFKEKKKR